MELKHNFSLRRNYHLKDCKSSCILKDTKELLINSNSYNRYLSSYQTKSQIATFKTPTITLYPIFRDPSSISLVRKQYQTSNVLLNSTKQTFPSLTLKDKAKTRTARRLHIRNHGSLNLLPSVKSFRDHLLYELIPKYKYSQLQYDESVIFHNRSKYNKVIFDKFMLAKDKLIENYTIEKKYVFNENSSNEIILTINSMKIEFTNMTDKNKKPLSLDIPFAYMFLFYYKGIDYFKNLLLNIIRFANDEFDCIEFNDCDISEIIKHSKEDFNTLIDIDKTNKSNLLSSVNGKDVLGSNRTINLVASQNLLTIKKELERKSSSYYSKLNTKAHYHIYNFIWNTPNYVYNVNIKLPLINVILPKNKKQIIKGFEDELFLFIFEKNFLDWDFYIISYLFSLKSFRLLMEATLSKKKQFKPQSKFTKRMNKEYEKINISSTKTQTYSYLDDSAVFYYTNNKHENYISTLHSFSIKIDYNNLNPRKRFLFEFNFNQMKLLNKIAQYESLERFIKKIVITEFDKGEINIDYSMFNNFNENYFDGKQYRGESALGTVHSPDINVLVSEATNREKSELKKKEMKIKIERPWIEKTEINKQHFIINDLAKKFIPCDLLSEMVFKEIIEWPKMLLDNCSRIITRSISSKKKSDRKNTTKSFRTGMLRSPTTKNNTSKLTKQGFSLIKISEFEH